MPQCYVSKKCQKTYFFKDTSQSRKELSTAGSRSMLVRPVNAINIRPQQQHNKGRAKFTDTTAEIPINAENHWRRTYVTGISSQDETSNQSPPDSLSVETSNPDKYPDYHGDISSSIPDGTNSIHPFPVPFLHKPVQLSKAYIAKVTTSVPINYQPTLPPNIVVAEHSANQDNKSFDPDLEKNRIEELDTDNPSKNAQEAGEHLLFSPDSTER